MAHSLRMEHLRTGGINLRNSSPKWGRDLEKLPLKWGTYLEKSQVTGGFSPSDPNHRACGSALDEALAMRSFFLSSFHRVNFGFISHGNK